MKDCTNQVEIVELEEGAQHLLGQALLRTARWRDTEPTQTLAQQLELLPRLAVYLEGWGRDGDVAFAARSGSQTLGLAWYRLFKTGSPGYGFVSEDIPELGISVWPEFRGQGVGTTLMRTLLECAAPRFLHLSLSVSEHNSAARALYASVGVTEVRREGPAITMLSPILSETALSIEN